MMVEGELKARATSEIYSKPVNTPQPTMPCEVEALEKWVEDLSQYERMLEDMAKASLQPSFKEELGAVDGWFSALSEGERTAALYTLTHKCTPVQVRFFITVLQKMVAEPSKEGLRTFNDFQATRKLATTKDLVKEPTKEASKDDDWRANRPRKLPGLDIKAAVHWGHREINSGSLQRPMSAAHTYDQAWRGARRLSPTAAYKSPAFPPGLSATSPKWPVTPTDVHYESPKESPKDKNTMEVVDFELLKDIPAWMRSLRLHKYTSLFEKMHWRDIVAMDDQQLTDIGVAALGARRKFLKIFENIKKEAEDKGLTPSISNCSSDGSFCDDPVSETDQPTPNLCEKPKDLPKDTIQDSVKESLKV
ncbi:Flap-structured DNA-binding and RNA-binding protein [Entomophthora muscae]|uniref:Flap-structured DNA-binding and RNA-binding protein n=1 Tax=Entomophthora muscae TaxID=34485 RepID=A0ACC2TTN3_9FUNG|nr:Flap-structured DNA-binding and RNA-binding protein [Entomophthora muscae]